MFVLELFTLFTRLRFARFWEEEFLFEEVGRVGGGGGLGRWGWGAVREVEQVWELGVVWEGDLWEGNQG